MAVEDFNAEEELKWLKKYKKLYFKTIIQPKGLPPIENTTLFKDNPLVENFYDLYIETLSKHKHKWDYHKSEIYFLNPLDLAQNRLNKIKEVKSFWKNKVQNILPNSHNIKIENLFLKTLRFKIGDKYDNRDLKLRSASSFSRNDLNYQIYFYTKTEFKEIFSIAITNRILVLYHLNILEAVYYRFYGNQFQTLLDKINDNLPSNNKMLVPNPNFDIAKVEFLNGTELILELSNNGDTILVFSSKEYNKDTH
ncbi:hypothetical protein [Polaribacter atrinae]|uniref:hypothetical protein n=1 Tax=Polaribacter atrinae TaxID=1333662 RepID=UPI0030F8A516